MPVVKKAVFQASGILPVVKKGLFRVLGVMPVVKKTIYRALSLMPVVIFLFNSLITSKIAPANQRTM
ncbi:MAG: hypothetical protein V4560_16555 [Bacteroidota bacterium]